MNGWITHAEVLASQDSLGNVGVRLDTYDSSEGRWSYRMLSPELAIKVGEQLIRLGQNAITSNQIRDDPTHMLAMRERAADTAARMRERCAEYDAAFNDTTAGKQWLTDVGRAAVGVCELVPTLLDLIDAQLVRTAASQDPKP